MENGEIASMEFLAKNRCLQFEFSEWMECGGESGESEDIPKKASNLENISHL
jgi:hypothetical protein